MKEVRDNITEYESILAVGEEAAQVIVKELEAVRERLRR